MRINEEIKDDFRLAALEFFKDKLKITSKVQLVNGAPNVEAGDKIYDVHFPKAGIFTLDVAADDTFDFIRELAHNMVHVKQIEDKRLKLVTPGIVNFDGEEFHIKPENYKSDENDTPFDKEANALEKDLASSFWHHLNIKQENITIHEDLRPLPPGITYKYLRHGIMVSQIIQYNGKQIGVVDYTYEKFFRIDLVSIDKDFRRQGIYSNAIIDFTRKAKCPVISDNRNDNSTAVWGSLMKNLPPDLKIYDLKDNNKKVFRNTLILAPANFPIEKHFYNLNESFEPRSFIKDILTMQQVINMTSADDVNDVAQWLKKPADQVIWQYKEVPSHGFEEQVLNMIGSYKNFPKDKVRTQHIFNILKKGGKPQPIFVDPADDFILEGRHRIVAFFLMDMPMVPVIYVQ